MDKTRTPSPPGWEPSHPLGLRKKPSLSHLPKITMNAEGRIRIVYDDKSTQRMDLKKITLDPSQSELSFELWNGNEGPQVFALLLTDIGC